MLPPGIDPNTSPEVIAEIFRPGPDYVPPDDKSALYTYAGE